MPGPLRTFLFFWLPPGLYLGLIFLLSSLSSFPVSLPVEGIDKVVHAAEYSILALLLTRAVSTLTWIRTWFGVALFSLLLVAMVGTADEVYQSTVPDRDSDALDALADVIGGILGMGVFLLFRRRLGGRNRATGPVESRQGG